MMRKTAATLAMMLWPGMVLAHAGEGGFVLLLPTHIYMWAGAASVAATVLLIAVMPERAARAMFGTARLFRMGTGARASLVTSCLSALVMLWAVWRGIAGDQDPKHNILPLLVWTAMWVVAVGAQGVVGDLWRWISPFRGPYALIRAAGVRPLLRYPRWLGAWPAVVTYLGFSAFLLIDIAPADPDRLAQAVLGYWLITMLGLVVYGPVWLLCGEGLSVLMRAYAGLAPVRRAGGSLRAGLPGWHLARGPVPGTALAILMLVALGVGSFDGLNETFKWLGWIGVNPLEFTGRSAVVQQNALGLGTAIALLVVAYGLAVKAGLVLIGEDGWAVAFRAMAPAILPIALGYHIAHYLPSAMVDMQYLAHLLSEYLGGPEITVTTGFFNTRATVQAIWLTQAAFVVGGHVLAILMSHFAALRLYGSHGRAALSQTPLAVFMVFYTLFGLWLLASPRGA